MSPNIYMTVGISGSGKSHFYNKVLKPFCNVELNNDDVRRELTGSVSSQEKNEQVFEEVDKRIIAHLAGGQNVALTNTNLHLDRINEIARKFPYNKILVFLLKDSFNPKFCRKRVIDDLYRGIDRAATPEDIIEHQFENFKIFLEDLKTKEIEKNITIFWVESNDYISTYKPEEEC